MLTQAEECEAAAQRYEFENQESEFIANLYLVGSYILRPERKPAHQEQRRRYQRAAAGWFLKALAANEIKAESRAAITYLVAELERRTGDHAAAITHYDSARNIAGVPDWLASLIDEQRALAVKKDDNNDL